MIQQLINVLKGWGVACCFVMTSLLFQHYFRNPLCFSWTCIIWLLLGLLVAIGTYSWFVLPNLPNTWWIKNLALSFLFLISFSTNLSLFQLDYSNNLLWSSSSIITMGLLLLIVSSFTSIIIQKENRLIIRQINIRKRDK